MKSNKACKVETAESISGARDIQKHLDGLGWDYDVHAVGNWTEKTPNEGTPWHLNNGDGQEIIKLGTKYAHVHYDGMNCTIHPDSKGKIRFYIY